MVLAEISEACSWKPYGVSSITASPGGDPALAINWACTETIVGAVSPDPMMHSSRAPEAIPQSLAIYGPPDVARPDAGTSAAAGAAECWGGRGRNVGAAGPDGERGGDGPAGGHRPAPAGGRAPPRRL